MSSAPVKRSAGEPAGLARRARLRVGLAGGSQSQRAAVKDVLIKMREVEAEILDLGDDQVAPKSDAKIVLLAVLLDPADQQKWPAALQAARSIAQPPLVVGLLADRSSELIQAALRAGADDVFSLPPSSDDALRALLRANEFRRRAEKRNPNELCSLVSVSGGLGVSHLTVILGFAVRRLLEKRAALVDLDLQAAPLAVLLDVDPERTIADLADPTSPIDSIRLESVLAKHDSGLSLLAAPKQIEQAELVSAATVEAALKVLHVLFDVVLIDCGSHLNESSVVVFENSDHLLYVLDQSVTSIRAAQRFLNLYGRLGLNERQPHLVVNRYRSNDVIKLEQIETALHLPVFATVPLDNAVFRQMQVPGLDLWNISSGASLRRSFETLTRKLFVAEQSEAATKPSLFSRLFGSFGR